MKQIALTVVLAAFPAAKVWAQDSRDEDIFGSAQSPKEAPSSAGQTKALVDTLQIGGRLELRASTAQEEQQRLQEARFTPNKTADIYFDTRPSPDLRVLLRTRLYDVPLQQVTSGPEATAVIVHQEIDEFWFKWDWNDAVFMTVGKQHLKWGSGSIWNPTDFTARSPKDPFALFDRRLGQDLLKIHIPNERLGFNYYAILQFDNATRNDDIGAALRGEFAFLGAGEIALTAQTRRNKPQRLGLDISSALGPLDVKVEGALSRREDRSFFKDGILTNERIVPPTEYKQKDKQFGQVVAGLQHTFKYSDEDSITLGGEYFYNELGYTERVEEIYSIILQQSKSLYAGRRYAGAYVRLPSPGPFNKSSFFLTGLQNLSDKTSNIRLTGTWDLLRYASVDAYVSRCMGEYGELCFSAPDSLKDFGDLPDTDPRLKSLIAQLPSKRTIFTAGLGLTMNF